ncbi:MAG: 4-hydroxy-tetrahydrodipicolinate synthase [Campylobacterales bacterium]
MSLTGAMTALVTPIKNNRIDEETYVALIRRQIRHGIDVVVPVGTTGESATLTHEEHRRCIEIAVETCRGTTVKVMAGAGSNATHESVDLARFAQKAGADGILCVTPYYNKPTQEGLFAHYSEIAKAVDIPVTLYNVPGRTGVDLQPQTVARLHEAFPHITSIKEASGSLERCVELAHRAPKLGIISGDDAINYPILANGGVGVISVTSNLLPGHIAQIVHKTAAGEYEEARAINTALFPLNKALFVESNPIPIKAALYMVGVIPTLEYRLPLVRPTEATIALLKEVLKLYDIPGAEA